MGGLRRLFGVYPRKKSGRVSGQSAATPQTPGFRLFQDTPDGRGDDDLPDPGGSGDGPPRDVFSASVRSGIRLGEAETGANDGDRTHEPRPNHLKPPPFPL